MAVSWKPDGQPTVTPYLTVRGVKDLLDFVVRVLDAKVLDRHARPDGVVMHAQIQIADSRVMMGEAPDDSNRMPGMLYVYVKDTDAAYRKAIAAGAISLMAPADQFYGDRNAGVRDAWGNQWWFATTVEKVSDEEMERRSQEHMKKQAGR